MATNHDADADRRTSAEISDDLSTIRPPEVAVAGEPPADVVQAVEAAVEDEPNALDRPDVHEESDGACAATLRCRFNEIPQIGSDGAVEAWLAPYRSRQKVLAALCDHLPDDFAVEVERDHRLGFYGDGR
jgi:hypothetical protein